MADWTQPASAAAGVLTGLVTAAALAWKAVSGAWTLVYNHVEHAKAEIKAELADLKADLKADVAALRDDIRAMKGS